MTNNKPLINESLSASQSMLKITKANEPVQYQLQIVNRHVLPGLVPCYQRQQNGQLLICHDISGCVTLPEFARQGDCDPSVGERLIQEICGIIDRAASFLLPPSQFSLAVEHIFIRETDGPSCSDNDKPAAAVQLMFWPVCPGITENLDELFDQETVKQFAKEECQLVRDAFICLINDISQLFQINYTRREHLLHVLHRQGISGLAKSDGSDPDQPSVLQVVKRSAESQATGHQRAVSRNKTGRQVACSVFAILLHLLLFVSVAAIFSKLINPVPAVRALILTATLLLLAWNLRVVYSSVINTKKVEIRDQLSHWLSRLQQQISILNRPREQVDAEKTADRLQQTMILPADPALFRIATLTENPPGSAAEIDGLRVFILVEQFIIGRDQNKTDLCLSESGIGRQHARISRKGGTFFICDLGSKNGTRLDGHLLDKYQDTILPDTCQLQFADHLFYFKAED